MTEVLLQFKGMDASQFKVTDESGKDVPICPANPILQQQGGVTSTASVSLAEAQRVIKIERKTPRHDWLKKAELKEKQRYLVEYNGAVFASEVLEVAKAYLFIKTIGGSYWISFDQFKESVIELLKEKSKEVVVYDDKEKIALAVLKKMGIESPDRLA